MTNIPHEVFPESSLGMTPQNHQKVGLDTASHEVSAEQTGRVQRGRPFAPGRSGNPAGRPKGARNRHNEAFLSILADHFAEHGYEAFNSLLQNDPASYLRIMASFVRREQSHKDYSDLTDEEMVEVLERADRNRLVHRLIEAGDQVI